MPEPTCRDCVHEGTAVGGPCTEPRHQAPQRATYDWELMDAQAAGECTGPAHQVAPETGLTQDADPWWHWSLKPGQADAVCQAVGEILAAANPKHGFYMDGQTAYERLSGAVRPASGTEGPGAGAGQGEDLRDAIARALAAANDDGVFDEADRPDADVDLDSDEDVAWYRKLADAVLPAVQAHVAAEVERARAEADKELDEALRERDETEAIADRLAYSIAPREVIGEHSSGNFPWLNALDLAPKGGWQAAVDRARAEGAAEALKVVADHIEQVWKEADQPFREHELRAAAAVGYLRQEGPLILAKYADRIAGGEQRG